ncbi:hypothetical protein FRC04_003585 [Tulasnella sp. 424]|nr:hypothetical protein FRC04_003585 [Tulasnella sp. 424]KAG8965336.1 hypothetical protein FRC05_003281 [Tulasnella sp. 425]
MSLKKGQNTKKEEPSDRMKDPGGMEDVQQPEAAILIQLDLVPMGNQDMAVEIIYVTIERKALESGSTIRIQDLVANAVATPPMSERALILYRTALVGNSKVAIGSVTEVLAGTAPLLAFKQLSKVILEDKGGVYHTVLWYKPIQGEQPAAVANVAPTPQPHPAQLESFSYSMQEPNHGFHQSKLNLEILEWLRAELDGPTEPLPRAGSLSDAWARERLYRKVKSNADKRFKYKQSYKINIVDALQDICFLRHTNCANSTTGFANAEKDPEMAQWLNEEAKPGNTNFSSWSISKFWGEAQKRVETANKRALALQEQKQMKGQTEDE